jgi:hypothetical protein
MPGRRAMFAMYSVFIAGRVKWAIRRERGGWGGGLRGGIRPANPNHQAPKLKIFELPLEAPILFMQYAGNRVIIYHGYTVEIHIFGIKKNIENIY